MSEPEDTLQRAREEWAPRELAERMVRVVGPFAANPNLARNWLLKERQAGTVPFRPIPHGLDRRAYGHAMRRGSLPPDDVEYNLGGLILRLLECRAAAGWSVSVTMILRLATAGPDELDTMVVERLMAPADKPKNKGGAPTKYRWDEVAVAFAMWLDEKPERIHATPSIKRKAIEDFIQDLGHDEMPDPSTITPYAKRWCDVFRKIYGKIWKT